MSGVEQVPDWADKRVNEQFDAAIEPGQSEHAYVVLHRAFARYIAAHEEAPVDPLLLEARACAASAQSTGAADLTMAGGMDSQPIVVACLAALRRGIELAKTGGAA